MSEPKQNRGKSKQDYETPWPVVRAIERWIGESFTVDLAAREDNKKAPACITPEINSLFVEWHKLDGLLWLNPPYADIGTWALKCADEARLGARIVMLTPASVSTEWYANHCWETCQTAFLRPRIQFVGAPDPYPKDLMLTLWGFGISGYELCNWLSADVRASIEVAP